MSETLVLKCPICDQVLYEVEEFENFVPAGACCHCGGLLLFNPENMAFEQALKGHTK